MCVYFSAWNIFRFKEWTLKCNQTENKTIIESLKSLTTKIIFKINQCQKLLVNYTNYSYA